MSAARAKTFFGRIRPWQWIKHSIFSQYLLVWAMKVGSSPQAKTIWVIDAFAGAGEFIDAATGEKTEGSPVRAALIAKHYNEMPKKLAAGKQLRLICIERDPEHFEALKERLAGFDFATVLPGEFGKHADTILSMIRSDPALVLLDPIGVKSIDAATCKKLLDRRGKTDVFVNVQFTVVHRTRGQLLPDGESNPAVQGSAANAENIDAFFGTDEWRKRIAINGKPANEQEVEYLQLYYDSVVGPRFSRKNHYPVSATYGGKPKYYLVHIADHPDADWLINDLMATVESRLYVQSCQRDDPCALEGFYEDDNKRRIEQLRRDLGAAALRLLGEQPGETMAYESLCIALREQFFGQLKSGDYSKVVKQLFKDDKVTRGQKGVKPKLLPTEKITIASGTDS
jgi:three-Cys-motif partner protein